MIKVRGLVHSPRARKLCVESVYIFSQILIQVFCIISSGFVPLKLQTILERKENVADSAKALNIILGEGKKAPLFSALKSNHRMLRKMR